MALQPLTIFAKHSIWDVWHDSEYVSGKCYKVYKEKYMSLRKLRFIWYLILILMFLNIFFSWWLQNRFFPHVWERKVYFSLLMVFAGWKPVHPLSNGTLYLKQSVYFLRAVPTNLLSKFAPYIVAIVSSHIRLTAI